MKILLIGEYSGVHSNLAEGLRKLGHEVSVLSNGDFWKDYPRDLNLERKPGKLGGIRYLLRLLRLLPRLRGYDIVQFINPMFLELKAQWLFPVYRYLRRHNRKMVLGAFGMDWYWVHTCSTTMPLRYSDFNMGNTPRTNADAIKEQNDWLGTAKARLNKMMAEDCDAIVTGLYEYDVCYRPCFPGKTTFIPYPIMLKDGEPSATATRRSVLPVRIFVGISRNRSEYKGTDIMLRAAQAVAAKYPDRVLLQVAEGVPFAQYEQMLRGSDVILDQLYSYTPAMNALGAMAKGIVVVGGGEPENYKILNERDLRPIVNVLPDYEHVFMALEQLVLHPEQIPGLKQQGMEYIRRHHDHVKVAERYQNIYRNILQEATVRKQRQAEA